MNPRKEFNQSISATVLDGSGKRIGSGTEGYIYKISWNNIDVAIKIISPEWQNSIDTDEKANIKYQGLCATTNDILCKLMPTTHRNVHKQYGYGSSLTSGGSTHFFYISELMPIGDLQQYISLKPQVEMLQQLRWMRDAAAGIAYLHRRGVIHCDIKSANMLLDNELTLKVADFGLSQLVGEATHCYGSAKWMSPELLLKHAINTTQSDVYALATQWWAIAAWGAPYNNYNNLNIFKNVKFILEVDYGRHDPIPKDHPLAKYITFGWMKDPAARPAASELKLVAQLEVNKNKKMQK